jgi:hypothetical protein
VRVLSVVPSNPDTIIWPVFCFSESKRNKTQGSVDEQGLPLLQAGIVARFGTGMLP